MTQILGIERFLSNGLTYCIFGHVWHNSAEIICSNQLLLFF
jgi:hypothetical protein